MKIQSDDPLIDALLRGNDETVFNLVSLLRLQKDARLYTDGKSYLTAQTVASAPLWIYTDAESADTKRELFSVLSEATGEASRLKINAREGFAEKVLTDFAAQNAMRLSKRGTLNAYSAQKICELPPHGMMIPSEAEHEREIADMIQIATTDDGDEELSDEEAKKFARVHAAGGNLYFWTDGGIVSMARTVRYGKFGRITSVVTKREARGRSYAKMLVGTLAKSMLAEGLIPVLYAHAENLSANRCYLHIGFEKQGEICEFCLEKEL